MLSSQTCVSPAFCHVPSLHEVDLPACWASAIVNNDFSGLSPEEAADIENWFASNPHIGGNMGCEEPTFIGRFQGLQTEMMTFTFSLKPSL